MAIQKDYVINRKQYLDIKKKDHNQMNQFLQTVYKSAYSDGFKDGTSAVPGIDLTQIREILLEVKGLGEKRVETIIKALVKSFEKSEEEQ
jgi:hypothetical protein|uniref:Uncharacterized protein n=1 Tax=Siphoviridae sp. ct5d86 TaxID=2827561 RepID=A0A8S5LLS5_9CAUD|nr:MAG TPA: hypothetical protein [Siphoviridae sp. ct5d86]DAO25321.1 MAG TPA: hypothetical protein [Caudoviricetes sp.]